MSTREFLARRFGSDSLLDRNRAARGDTTRSTRPSTPTRPTTQPRTRQTPTRAAPTNSPSFVGSHTRLNRSGGSVLGTTTGYRQKTIAPGYADRFPGTGGPPLKRSYYHRRSRRYCGFYYGGRVAYAYVPFGFYGDRVSVYIDDSEGVDDEYEVDHYQERKPTADEEATYEAAAGSAAAERYMREATGLFAKAEYPEAARRFRLAAIASPKSAAPLFAMGQALITLENYPYAAKVIRQAIDLEPTLLREGGDLGAVYKSRDEFARVQRQVEQRIQNHPDDLHALFLLGVIQYYGGDPVARETFRKLAGASKNDRVVSSFVEAVDERFEKAKELPPIE
jgi:Flp pilus assembly protein TadD